MFSNVISEGSSAKSLPGDLYELFKKADLIDSEKIRFSGILRFKNREGLVAVLPRGFLVGSCSDLKLVSDRIFLMARVVSRCMREKTFRILFIDNGLFWPRTAFRDINLCDAIEAAYLLRRDFLENNYFWQKSKKMILHSWDHPVDWVRSTDVYPPEISGGQIFYRNTVHTALVRQSVDFVHRLHATCMDDIFRLTGENMNVSEGRRLDEDDYEKVILRPEAYILPLLNRMYRERGRMLLKLMMTWFRGRVGYSTSSADQPDATGFCCNYNLLWEHMLRKLLDNSGSPSERMLEAGLWTQCDGTESATGHPELDTLHITAAGEQYIRCLVDAKYKALSVPGRSGSSDDHYKQIMYARLTTAGLCRNLFNVLVFPCGNEDAVFRFLGCHRWRSVENSDVNELGADSAAIAESWLRGRKETVSRSFDCLVTELKHHSDSQI